MAADRVFLTGASGFVGAHVLRALLTAGYRVRALVRDDSHIAFDDDVEWTNGDLARSGEFAHALDGCRYLVHTAALYSFTPRDRADIYDVNVNGTASLLAAAHLAGIERAVLTSSSAAIGHAHGSDGRLPDERSYPPERPFAAQRGDYHASKLEQERAAFSARLPVVAVLPTAPVGPGDWKPTPTGRLVRDYMRGAISALPPAGGGMNLVPVEDVATAHVSALERGNAGERYVLGGENLEMDAIWRLLSEVTGRPLPTWRAPYALAYAVAAADEIRCRIDSDATPFAPLEGVRLSRERMYADSTKARTQLDFVPSPVRDAVERSVIWYRENGAS
ncbi:MAG TPA: NAD-dependent epimerase/dehydratase family protein [Candidatus Tumulicola sp.]